MPPRKRNHVKIRQAVLLLLRPLEAFGFLSAELPFRPAAEYESWTADIGFVSQERWEAVDNDYFIGARDLVVQVCLEATPWTKSSSARMFARPTAAVASGSSMRSGRPCW
jgi:hypothetical protein